MKALATKGPTGALHPADEDSVKAFAKLKQGELLNVEVKNIRNAQFFKKWFVLANFAYDHWEPMGVGKVRGEVPEKSFERFRKDLIILSGHYHVDYSLGRDGFRVVADSISWASMEEDTFEELYSSTVNVVLKHVLKNYTKEDLDNVIEELILTFG